MKKSLRILILALSLLIFMGTACSKPAATVDDTSNQIVVNSVTLAENLDENYQAVNPKTQFYPTDTIFVSVHVAGRPTTGTLNGKFFLDTQLISEATLDFSTVNQGLIFSVGEDTYAGFNLSPSQPWPVGTGYRFELYINGSKLGDYLFEVIQ